MTTERKQEQTRDQVTAHLPRGIRDQVRAAVRVDDTMDPAQWCGHLAAVLQLIDDPEEVVRAARETTRTPVCDR